MKVLCRYWKWMLSLLAGVAAMLFFAFPHSSLLNFHEQYQLFLFTTDYFCERATLPGGIAAYIAQFLTQFYYMPTVGAALLALLLVGLQAVCTVLHREKSSIVYVLSFVPMVLMVAAMGDENLMLAYLVSIDLALLVAYLFRVLPALGHPIVSIIVATAISYWIAGPASILTGILIALSLRTSKTWTVVAGSLSAIVLVFVLNAIVAGHAPYPSDRLNWGLFYYRFISPIKAMALCVPASIVIIAIATRILDSRLKAQESTGSGSRSAVLIPLSASAVILVSGLSLINNAYSTPDHDIIKYDCLLRTQNWDKIIEEASNKTPEAPFTVCALNLALGMKGQLNDKLFDYYQNGSEGLLNPFVRDYSAPMAAAEAYWQLGMVNTCQRYMFEAMEAVPDYQKSGRIIKRLVQTNIINGQYDVARKYAHMLQQTLFYSKWADAQLALISESGKQREDRVNADPLYSRMRQIRLTNDFLFSDSETDKIVGQLFIHDITNSLAMQYLIAFPLLDNDPNRFMAYMSVVQQRQPSYMPRYAREAISRMRK